MLRSDLVLTFLICLTVAAGADARVNVLACEPEWAALADVIGGDAVRTRSATTGRQDPHHIQARPSLIAAARRADLLICTGAELEIGWLPLLLSASGNATIQRGAPGYFIATGYVRLAEIPAVADRAAGDIHSAGNPHIQTDPRNMLPVATALAARLGTLDPDGAGGYDQRLERFTRRWNDNLDRWALLARPLRGRSIVVFHDSWPYLESWLGLTQSGTLEPKPGVPPTTSHLTDLVRGLGQRPANVIVTAAYQDPKPAAWLSERTGIPSVTLPFTVGGTDDATNLEKLYDVTLQRLLDTAIR